MPPKPSKAYRRLLKEGWRDSGLGKGSHRVLTKNGATITIPYHAREFKKGLWETIKKRAGWQ